MTIFFPRARRRSPGVYWYRTRRHLSERTEWGYVGKSNHLALRADCHEGRCTRHPGCHGGKPWADLIVRRGQIRLPWWLGWQPVTLSLETLVIWFLRPRYNWQKNPRRSKVPTRIQELQRAARDGVQTTAWLRPEPTTWPRGNPPVDTIFTDIIVRLTAVALLLAGVFGMLLSR